VSFSILNHTTLFRLILFNSIQSISLTHVPQKASLSCSACPYRDLCIRLEKERERERERERETTSKRKGGKERQTERVG
jgi:hypothetical protein